MHAPDDTTTAAAAAAVDWRTRKKRAEPRGGRVSRAQVRDRMSLSLVWRRVRGGLLACACV